MRISIGDGGVVPRVEEEMEEIRVKQEPFNDFVNVNLPSLVLAMRTVEEVALKQEFIEKCAKRRPLLRKYISHYSEKTCSVNWKSLN